MDIDSLEMNIEVPADFLKHITLIPHNFNQPENPRHSIFIHNQIRYHIFNITFYKISMIEQRHIKNDSDFMKIDNYNSENCLNLNLHQRALVKKFKQNDEDEYLTCEQWTVNHSDKFRKYYSIYYFHSVNDNFYSVVLPPGVWDSVYGIWKLGSM